MQQLRETHQYGGPGGLPRLPPLSALRVFEAAGRLGSFSRAAEQLHITPSAVSHQIRALEDHLGVPLFRRTSRQVTLTREGETLLPAVQAAFAQIAAATQRVAAPARAPRLAISVMPTFAIRWLVPRLGRFQKLHPEIEVRLDASVGLADFARSDVDLAVRYGKGDWPGVHAEKILSEEIFPVCSPALLAGDRPLAAPADLAHHTLLHVELLVDYWRMWLTAAGVEGVDPEKGPRFSSSTLALDAAATGLGVAIAQRAMVADDLRQGRLVAPFDLHLPDASAHYFVCLPARLDEPKVAAFRAWLLDELAAAAAADDHVQLRPEEAWSASDKPSRRGAKRSSRRSAG